MLCDLPPDSSVVGIPARIVRIAGQKVDYATEVDQVSVRDPMADEIAAIKQRLAALEKKEAE